MKPVSTFGALVLAASMAFMPGALAQSEQQKSQSRSMMQGMHGAHHGGWMAELDDKQHNELNRIKAEYMKEQVPLKARLKAKKAELMTLALADSPDKGAIDKAIDEMAELKRQMLRNKVDKISARRQVLNEQQRALYDIHVMKKAAGKRGGHGAHHGMGHGMQHGMGHGKGHGMGMHH